MLIAKIKKIEKLGSKGENQLSSELKLDIGGNKLCRKFYREREICGHSGSTEVSNHQVQGQGTSDNEKYDCALEKKSRGRRAQYDLSPFVAQACDLGLWV